MLKITLVEVQSGTHDYAENNIGRSSIRDSLYDKGILNTSVIWVNGKQIHELTKTQKCNKRMLNEQILFHK